MKASRIIAVIGLAACCVVAHGQGAREQAVNSFLRKMASNESKQALLKTPANDEKLPKIIVNSQGEAFILKRVKKDFTSPDNEDLFASNTSIFPGAIVWADTDLADGRPTLVGLSYGTVDVEVDFNTGSKAYKRNVRNDKASVNDAIYSILGGVKASYEPPVSISSNETETSSLSQMSMKLGADVKYLQNKVGVDTKTTNSESKVIHVQDFTQKYYTVSITPYADNELYKYFGSDVTEASLRAKIGNKPVAVINSVSYGRRIYYFEEYKTSDFSFSGSEKASMKIGGFEANAASSQDITKNSKSSKKWMFIDGGSQKPAQEVMNGKSAKKALAAEGTLTIGPGNQGIPISFTAQFLASRRNIAAKATGTYYETSYVKCPKTVRWEIKNKANTAGDCIKFKAMYNVICVTGNAKDGYSYEVIEGKGSGDESFADYIENKYSNNTQKTRTMPTSDIEKYKLKSGKKVKMANCYVLGPCYYTIRSKTADVAGVKWHQDEDGWFDVTGGSVKVSMQGSALAGGKGVYVHSSSSPNPINK